MNGRLATRKFYAFDRRLAWLVEWSGYLTIPQLQRLAAYVWAAERQRGPVPRVVAGRGILWGGSRLSYYRRDDPVPRIELSRHQRDVGTLLHELAHAMGPWDKLDHGPAFTARCFHLYLLYGRINPARLMEAAMETRLG
jgi:hypothetical protein